MIRPDTDTDTASRRVLAACALVAMLMATAYDASAAKRRADHAASAATQGRLIARTTPFSSGPLAATAPPGWEVQTLPKVEHQTRYDLVMDDGTIVVDATGSGPLAGPTYVPLEDWRSSTHQR